MAIFAFAVVAFVLGSRSVLGWSGDPGWAIEASGVPYAVSVSGVVAGGPAERGGARVGDAIDLRSLSTADRIFIMSSTGWNTGHQLHVLAGSHGQRRSLTVDPVRKPMRWDTWLAYALIGWMALFAGAIAWRRPDLVDARLLSAMLSCYVAGQALQFLAAPSPGVTLAAATLSNAGVLGTAFVCVLIAFTALYGRPLARTRRIVNWIAYALAALMAIRSLLFAIGVVTLWFDPVPVWSNVILVDGAAFAMALVASALAIGSSRGFERQRVTWAVLSIGLLLGIFIVQAAFDFLNPGTDLWPAIEAAGNVAAVVAPIGLTYSVLSRRLLDIGFVLNRAAVFSAVSIIVVGLFMIVETVIGGWLVTVKHATTPMTGILIALCLGFSVRFIHKRVDAVVDRFFFHRRHEHERALLAFANEAAFVTDASELLARTVSEVAHHSETSEVAVLAREGTVFRCVRQAGMQMDEVAENDPAILAMRASAKPLDLHTRASALRGEYAFPMLARGALIGVLLCGRKRSGDAYAPDELAALTELARCVAMALDALAREQAPHDAALRAPLEAAIAALHDEFAAVRTEIRELRAALAPPRPPTGWFRRGR